MKWGKPIRGFDALAFKRRVQAQIAAETRGMTHAEEIEYYRTAAETGPLAEWWKRAKAAKAPSALTAGSRTVRKARTAATVRRRQPRSNTYRRSSGRRIEAK